MTGPIVLGLTGSIGMGKSTTADMFRAEGIPVWDADATVEDLYRKGGEAVAMIERVFPTAIKDGAVDKTALKSVISADAGALDQLNAIVHPLVAASRAKFLELMSSEPLIVLDVPLLFETGLDQHVDRVAVVTVSADEQRKRVLERGAMTEEMLDIILSRQTPDAAKREKADYIIETETFGAAREAVRDIITKLVGTI